MVFPWLGLASLITFFILAGDYLDTHLCVHLGLSTMFAAALGNIVSDIGGITFGGYLELLGNSLGLKHHNMSIAQLRTWTAWFVKYTAMMLGISTGCIIGMFPFVFPERWMLWQSNLSTRRKQCP